MGNCRCYNCISFNGNFLIVKFFYENRISFRKSKNKILEKNKNNQEAYIIKISSLFLDKKFNQIKELRDNLDQPNELLDFIFFTNNRLKDSTTISRSLVEIVASSFSNNEERR